MKKVPSKDQVWPSKGLRRVSVNSFGFGGANSHMVLDDALHYLEYRGLTGSHQTIALSPAIEQEADVINGNGGVVTPLSTANTGIIAPLEFAAAEDGFAQGMHSWLLVWTANDENSLKRMVESYEAYIKKHVIDEVKLSQLALTLAKRRSRMLWRAFTIVTHNNIRTINLSRMKMTRSSMESGLAFIFTGQGAQYINMGLELLKYPVFKTVLLHIEAIYRNLGCEWSIQGRCGYDVLSIMFLTLFRRDT